MTAVSRGTTTGDLGVRVLRALATISTRDLTGHRVIAALECAGLRIDWAPHPDGPDERAFGVPVECRSCGRPGNMIHGPDAWVWVRHPGTLCPVGGGGLS